MFEAHESRTTEIDAPIDVVYGVITDFEKYPEWATSLERVVIGDGRALGPDKEAGLPDEVEFFGGAVGFKVRYRLRYEYEPPRKLSWQLVNGEIRGLLLRFSISSLDGSYVFEPLDEGRTLARYSLRVALPVGVGPLRRKAEEIVMDTGLRDLRHRAESLVAKEDPGRPLGGR